jgi:hypothetical protein
MITLNTSLGNINTINLNASTTNKTHIATATSTNNTNIKASSTLPSKNSNGVKMELLVENWLNENKDWFKRYAIENLDLNTVEKWLRSNNKKICKCNNYFNKSNSNISFDVKDVNGDDDDDCDEHDADGGLIETAHLAYNLFNKRNSLSGLSFLNASSKDFVAKLNSNEKKSNTPINGGNATKFLGASLDANSNMFTSCLNTKRVKFFNKDLLNDTNNNNKEDDLSTADLKPLNWQQAITEKQSLSHPSIPSLTPTPTSAPSSTSTVQMLNNICMSHSHACIIHNRPPSCVNGKQKNNVSVFFVFLLSILNCNPNRTRSELKRRTIKRPLDRLSF